MQFMHSTSITLIEHVVPTNQAAATCLPPRHATPAVDRVHNVAIVVEALSNAAAALNIDTLETLSSAFTPLCAPLQ